MSQYLNFVPIIPDNKISHRCFSNTIDIGIMCFTKCNLACDFCCLNPQRRSTPNKHILDDYLNRIENILKTIKVPPEANIQLQGGELFADFVPDEYYDCLENFLHHLRTLLKKHGVVDIGVCCVTNLCYKKIDRAMLFCQNNNITLDTSYDFVGRFNKKYQHDLWMNNIEHLNNVYHYKPTISIVGHLANINEITNHNTFFKKMYSEYHLKIEPYDKFDDIEQYTTNQSQWIDFISFLIDHYPQTEPANFFINSFKSKTRIKQESCDLVGIDCLPDETWGACCDKYKNISKMMMRFSCWQCPHYQYCPIPCPSLCTNDVCTYQKIYNKVSDVLSNR